MPHLAHVPLRISLMASGELRDALTAIEEGNGPAAVVALMAIDPESWKAIEYRISTVLGTDLRALLLAAECSEPEATEA